MTVEERIKTRALEIGFDLAGIAAAGPVLHAQALQDWLAAGHHADMEWLARGTDRRADPRRVLEGARSVVVVGRVYHLAEPLESLWNDPLRGRIARYAWHRDYHKVMEPMLRRLATAITEELPGSGHRAYVDTGPVMEHEWAARAGLGFTGRHTLLIHPALGSLLHLGVVLTTAELQPDPPAGDDGASIPVDRGGAAPARASCGSCRRCLDACPTHAFPAPYILNSRLCIAYQTIENRGAIPEALRPRMGNWIFGCDDCQTVCPYVKGFLRGRAGRENPLPADRIAPRLEELLALRDDDAFVRRYAGTPLIRAKRRGLVRNALVALGNSGRPEGLSWLADFLARESDPLLLEHARWAQARLQ